MKEKYLEEKLFGPIIEIEDEVFLEDPTNLDIINTYFTCINIPDLDENHSENDLTNLLPFTTPSHVLNNNLQALSL